MADVSGYATAYVVSAGIQLAAIPFLLSARRERASCDPMDEAGKPVTRD